MKVSAFAKQILFSGDIENKLFEVESIEFDGFDLIDVPSLPVRSHKIQMSKKTAKFPKGNLDQDLNKARALHSFANHELLAIEMMACALLIYPHDTEELVKFKRGVISALKDEQKHFRLYCERLNELGYEFGDFELNSFFWKQMNALKTPAQYLATLSLTFEAANLDFAMFYASEFRKIEDHKTADILDIVLKDEISHVGFGVNYLTKWREDKTLWEYYTQNLPFPVTPARSKGKIYERSLREKAKMPPCFLSSLENFDDNFAITKRREWKR